MSYLKDKDRGIILLLLDKVEATGDAVQSRYRSDSVRTPLAKHNGGTLQVMGN